MSGWKPTISLMHLCAKINRINSKNATADWFDLNAIRDIPQSHFSKNCAKSNVSYVTQWQQLYDDRYKRLLIGQKIYNIHTIIISLQQFLLDTLLKYQGWVSNPHTAVDIFGHLQIVPKDIEYYKTGEPGLYSQVLSPQSNPGASLGWLIVEWPLFKC